MVAATDNVPESVTSRSRNEYIKLSRCCCDATDGEKGISRAMVCVVWASVTGVCDGRERLSGCGSRLVY